MATKSEVNFPKNVIIPVSAIAGLLGAIVFVTTFYIRTKDLPEKISAIEKTVLAIGISQYKICVSLQKDDPNLACTIPVVSENQDHVSSN